MKKVKVSSYFDHAFGRYFYYFVCPNCGKACLNSASWYYVVARAHAHRCPIDPQRVRVKEG